MKRNHRFNSKRRKQGGQTIAEYVLIIAIVVVAAIGILSVFSDTVRQKIAGATAAFGGDDSAIDSELSDTSRDIFEETGSDYQ